MKKSPNEDRYSMRGNAINKAAVWMLACLFIVKLFNTAQAAAPPATVFQLKINNSVSQLKKAPEIPIKIDNSEGAPLTITSASVKAAYFKGSYGKSDYIKTDVCVIEPYTTLINNSDRRVMSFVLQFINMETGWKGAVAHDFLNSGTLEPNKSYTESKCYYKTRGRPGALVVKVRRVEFEDGSYWGGKDQFAILRESDTPKVVGASTEALESLITKRVKPKYPDEAKRQNITGEIPVDVTVDEEGKVMSAKASSGHPLLKQAAEEAVSQWQFKAVTLSDYPVKLLGKVVIKFH